jgi:hypothetical protein
MTDSPPFKRPNFFPGKVLTPEDLELEQQYFRGKLKLHNRSLHGFGIVSGLNVTVESGQIVVEAGLALDCEGNELVIDVRQSIAAPDSCETSATYLNVRFVETGADFVPGGEGEQSDTIIESSELGFATENSNRSHRHLRARWLACGQPHALTIAKLRRGTHGWRVDRGYRPPKIK